MPSPYSNKYFQLNYADTGTCILQIVTQRGAMFKNRINFFFFLFNYYCDVQRIVDWLRETQTLEIEKRSFRGDDLRLKIKLALQEDCTKKRKSAATSVGLSVQPSLSLEWKKTLFYNGSWRALR